MGFLDLFWRSPYAGPAVVWLIVAGGACYILGAIVYGLRKPDPWPMVYGFHEIFHTGTVLGYACHVVAIYFVIVSLMQSDISHGHQLSASGYQASDRNQVS